MAPEKTFKGRGMLCAIGLLLIGSAGTCLAQATPSSAADELARASSRRPIERIDAMQTRRLALIQQARADARDLEPELERFPVVVLPQRRGFHDIQDALDFRSTIRSSRAIVLLIDANTYLGNWVVPPFGTTIVVGREGKYACKLKGQTGVNQPAVRFAPVSGPTEAELILHGLTIVGVQQAAIDYVGTTSQSQLNLDDCLVTTESAIPAIRVSGNGYAVDDRMELGVLNSDVYSMGYGIEATVGDYVDVFCLRSVVSADDVGIDMQAPTSGAGTELILAFGASEGQTTGMRASNISHVWCGLSFVNADQTVLDFTDCPDVRIENGEMYSSAAGAVRVSNSEIELEWVRIGSEDGFYGVHASNSSQVHAAYTHFNTQTLAYCIYLDATSTSSTMYNHWRFAPGP